MYNRVSRIALVAFVLLLVAVPAPVLANGSANDPHISSRPDTSALMRGDVIPHLELTKGWIQAKGDRFHFILELASLPAMGDIPRDAVYVFHYTMDGGRLYWRAQWAEDGFRFQGGMYVGCSPPVCPADRGFDAQGNRNYFYMPGNASQAERVRGEVIPGAPGRIVWSYPMSAYSDNLHGLEFKGLFAATYTLERAENGEALRYADIALGVKDFQHFETPPWHARLRAMIPGPSPVLVALGALALVGLAGHRFRSR
jgi:hypothetical protein